MTDEEKEKAEKLAAAKKRVDGSFWLKNLNTDLVVPLV
jgi:hypothetical protein